MRMYDIITKKKNSSELSKEMIDFFISGVTDGSIPDYQISALLMAICINGMSSKETAYLTMAMAKSGQINDLSEIKGEVVDKHSSGGVGDKCTLVIGPIVSSCGVPFAKLSGRSLGYTGGTIDKLESIAGMRTSMTREEFIAQVNEIGIAIAGGTSELAPADKKLYAIRDLTATVNSIPLISASIMSKKLAGGANNILLDVKCGNGAFMKTKSDAFSLANEMLSIGKKWNKNVQVYVTDMNQPLGSKVGNFLEVEEAYEVLQGNGPKDLIKICISLSAGMLEMAGVGNSKYCENLVNESIKSGIALAKFRELIINQGGQIDSLGKPICNEKTKFSLDVIAEDSGYVYEIETEKIGIASLIAGAGKENLNERIHPMAGLLLHKKKGSFVKVNETLVTVYGDSMKKLKESAKIIKESYIIKKEKPENSDIIIKVFKQLKEASNDNFRD